MAAYTTIDDPSAYFQTKIYTGTGSSNAFTLDGNSNLQPDWVWIKHRGEAHNHYLYDSVRGVQLKLSSNTTAAEIDMGSGSDAGLTAFGSNGFTIGGDTDENANSESYVAWNWKAGGSASSNSNGSITSSVSANTTAGFSIVTWTAGSGVGSIGHGLGVAPSMIIVKGRSSAIGWVTGLKSNGWNNYLQLQSTNPNNDDQRMFSPSGQSNPTSTVWYQDHAALGSSGDTMVGYVFAEKKGYSKFGSYTGNGQDDNTFIYLGFKPAFIMIKKTDSSDGNNNWVIVDNKRLGYNVDNNPLYPNTTGAEVTSDYIDLLSNGVKIRNGANEVGRAGVVYIYMAFAENPFVNSNGIPTTAR
jgi:hypothetical protein